jgi:transaldolase
MLSGTSLETSVQPVVCALPSTVIVSVYATRAFNEIEMYIDEDDETIVMQKVSSLTKQAKEVGFKIGEIEFKGPKHREQDRHYNKHHNEDDM